MPAVNAGPSNTQTQNITAGMVNSPSANNNVGPLQIGQNGIGIGIASTGTMGANGALTLGTALATGAYSAGLFLFFPAGAVYSGSLANFYFVKMSSTTVGTVYNNVYVAVNGAPTIPATLVNVSDAGPGAYTGVTTIQTVLQLAVPANVMGPNGALQTEVLFSYTNSAGTKTLTGTLVGQPTGVFTFLSAAVTTTATLYQIKTILNRGVTGIQTGAPAGSGAVIGANAASMTGVTAIDTVQPSTISVVMTLNTATDNCILEYYRFAAYYGA